MLSRIELSTIYYPVDVVLAPLLVQFSYSYYVICTFMSLHQL